jgi:hypothetical protein
MRSWIGLLLGVSILAVAGCAAENERGGDAGAAWVGTITTEDDITTVRNQAGSLWGGTARLIEEASIGVEAGEDAYMFGRVRSVAASPDRIYVLDSQVPALRAYDRDGRHVMDLGREGEGPGEFRNPSAVGVDAEGRVWLHDQGQQRIIVFAPGGEAVETLSLGGARISGSTQSMVLSPDGRAFILDVVRPEGPDAAGTDSRIVMRPHALEGEAGEPIDLPSFESPAYLEARGSNMVRFQEIPFRANGTWALTTSAALLIGYPDTYRFEIRHRDGRITAIERDWQDRIAVAPDEADAYREAAIAFLRGADPEWVWPDPEIPQTKPAFSRFVPAQSGEVWVVRPGPAALDTACNEEDFPPSGEPHCWREEPIIDVFGAGGRYLGRVVVPAELQWDPLPFINGREIIARVDDTAGTVMVKRYRVELPDGADP